MSKLPRPALFVIERGVVVGAERYVPGVVEPVAVVASDDLLETARRAREARRRARERAG